MGDDTCRDGDHIIRSTGNSAAAQARPGINADTENNTIPIKTSLTITARQVITTNTFEYRPTVFSCGVHCFSMEFLRKKNPEFDRFLLCTYHKKAESCFKKMRGRYSGMYEIKNVPKKR